MRPRTLTAIAAVGLALAAPVAFAGQQSTSIGSGKKTCVLKPGADCRGVVHRWTVEHHGNLRRAKFTKADLRGADFRGADLRGADFRGAKLHHADLRDARLKGARFDAVGRANKSVNDVGTSCDPNCPGADLYGANLAGANLANTNLTGADLAYANLTRANLAGARTNNKPPNSGAYPDFNSADEPVADFYGANLMSATLTNTELVFASFNSANLTGANLTGANLAWARFAYANLTGANFTRTNIASASLGGANITGVNFTSAEVTGVFWTITACPGPKYSDLQNCCPGGGC